MEYKVVPFQAKITESERNKGLAHQLTAEQLQEVINTHTEDGFTLSNNIDVPVLIKPGCFGQPQTMNVTNLVFTK